MCLELVSRSRSFGSFYRRRCLRVREPTLLEHVEQPDPAPLRSADGAAIPSGARGFLDNVHVCASVTAALDGGHNLQTRKWRKRRRGRALQCCRLVTWHRRALLASLAAAVVFQYWRYLTNPFYLTYAAARTHSCAGGSKN
eukprot:3236877-Pyramimonas_sp.AAC.1